MAVENFNDGIWAENDPNSHITITSDTKIDWADLHRAEEARVYKDKGAAHFAGDFEHWVDVFLDTDDTWAHASFWALANIIDDETACDLDAGGHLLCMFYNNNNTHQIEARARHNGINDDDDFYVHSLDTTYYLKIVRDESAGTYGHLYVYIYSNVDRTTLLDTLDVTLGEKTDFRYIYAVQADAGSSWDRTSTGWVQNLDLKEAAGGTATAVTTTVDNLTLTEYNPAINYAIKVAVGVDALSLTEYATTITRPVNVSAGVDALTLTEYNPTINYHIKVGAGLDSLSLTEYVASVLIGANIDISAGIDALTLIEYNPTINYHIKVATVLDSLSLTEYNPAVKYNIKVTTTVDALSLTEYNPAINYHVKVGAGVDVLTLTEYAASIGIGASTNVAAGLDTLVLTEYNPTINYHTKVTTVLDSLFLTEYNPVINYHIKVSAGIDSLALTKYNAAVNASILVGATSDSLVLTEYAATITAPSAYQSAVLVGVNVITGKFQYIIGKIKLG